MGSILPQGVLSTFWIHSIPYFLYTQYDIFQGKQNSVWKGLFFYFQIKNCRDNRKIKDKSLYKIFLDIFPLSKFAWEFIIWNLLWLLIRCVPGIFCLFPWGTAILCLQLQNQRSHDNFLKLSDAFFVSSLWSLN